MKKVYVRNLIKDLNLDIVYCPEEVDYYIESSDINRPGLQLAGYFGDFSYDRIQIIGKGEYNYFEHLDEKIRKERLDKLFSYEIPALIVTRGLKVNSDTIDAAKKYKKIILSTNMNTTRFINRVSNYLNEKLAASKTMHGVLVDVDGIGILIIGESGVGKSETALELIKRGHRLVADDAVEIRKIDEDLLLAQAPETIRHLMEIRGIGILDIKSLYGVGAVKLSKNVDMVIELQVWKEGQYYDRLGIEENYMEILGVPVEHVIIPVRPGRNIAMIIEVAAKNHRQKAMGYNAARDFNDRLMKKLSEDK
ncbi:Hpr(Ser) kinase/phosphatase [Alkalithermobacter thermoalcaliphilus JW-YL-7 = DSM 7308]|uniref:HPr kinase/phosphorylase n=1 Tax=Alkalithermobacter thermoalcaliphilus JW-YL-7 = DSM 7308 TaxID=1121328 RepID=A0A150FS93_CLOPD|nr:HPr kinase [[Clostridium] paradoxum JW-YL-7 = DSM 7308]SHL16354.1 Hpr(Ser) kinase/phosphatase [[Clostridium] paradoxum JW-YL-7 = DSM 7308]